MLLPNLSYKRLWLSNECMLTFLVLISRSRNFIHSLERNKHCNALYHFLFLSMFLLQSAVSHHGLVQDMSPASCLLGGSLLFLAVALRISICILACCTPCALCQMYLLRQIGTDELPVVDAMAISQKEPGSSCLFCSPPCRDIKSILSGTVDTFYSLRY